MSVGADCHSAVMSTPRPDDGSFAHRPHPEPGDPVPAAHIDCDSCLVRGLHCHDCVVTVLLGPPEELALDADDRAALHALAQGGLVPPLRLVRPVPSPPIDPA